MTVTGVGLGACRTYGADSTIGQKVINFACAMRNLEQLIHANGPIFAYKRPADLSPTGS